MALFFTYRLVFKRNKWLIPLLGLLAICAALLISASAPGNTIRQEHFQGMNPIAAVITSFEQSARFVMYFVQKPIYFAFAFIVSLLYKIASNSKFSFRWPGAVTILLYSVYASNYTPNLYAMSSFGPARVANVNYYVFLLFLLFTTVYWCGWIARKFPYKSSRSEIKKKQPTKDLSVESTVNGLLAICFIFGCLILSSYNINTITSVSAIKSLVTGETKTYHEEYLSRLELYTNSEIRQIEVPAFTARPYVLYFDDITPDSDDWRNISLASYYNKDSIVVKE